MANLPYQLPLVCNSCNMSTSSSFQNAPMLDEIPESEHLGCSFGRKDPFNNNEACSGESNNSWELSSLVSQELKHVDQVSEGEKHADRKRKNIEFEAGEEENSEKKLRQASTPKVVVATTSLKTDGKKQKKVPEKATTGYIHVRARRGEATDSHSLAERARREKINARFRLLQSLVPGCDEITGKPQKLDAIINYVQSLQNTVKGYYELGLQSQLQPEVILSEALNKENIISTSLVNEMLLRSLDEQMQNWQPLRRT